MALVLDASMALAWCFPDERSAWAESIYDSALDDQVVVPQHFLLEIANVLTAALPRKRLTSEDASLFIAALRDLDVRIDGDLVVGDVLDIAAGAAECRLTAYDWCYVNLALELNARLATLDRALADTAKRRGIRVVGLR